MNESKETTETTEKYQTSNPKEFIDKFSKSAWYKEAYNNYFKGKKIKPTVTEERKKKAFLSSDDAKFALVDFGTKEAHLRYKSNEYSEKSREALRVYIESADAVIEALKEKEDQDWIEFLDREKFIKHENVAQALVNDGIVPTDKLGRALARLILIDLGKDTPASAREPDILRIRRKMGLS